MESDGRLKQGEKEETNSKSNGGRTSKSNAAGSKGRTQDRRKTIKCVSVKKNNKRR